MVMIRFAIILLVVLTVIYVALSLYSRSVRRGKLGDEQAAANLALISGSTDYASLADVDLVIEAVFEDPQLKREIFARLDGACKPGRFSQPTRRTRTSTRSPRQPADPRT